MSKQVAAAQWALDGELFYVDISEGKNVHFGAGHEAVMDSEGGHVLFSKGYGSELYLYVVEEGRQYVVMNQDYPKSTLRSLAGGKSVIFSSITGHRGTAYDIWLFDFAKRKCKRHLTVSESFINNRVSP